MSRRLIPLLLVLGTLLIGTPAHAAPRPVRVLTFNICGNVCRHGEVARTAGNIAYQIRGRRVAVALLQEVCFAQFLGVRTRLARYGYTAMFAGGGKGGRCDDVDRAHGTAFGVAIVARGRLTGRSVWTCPARRRSGRRAGCCSAPR
jgi:hypothetical protein